MAFSQSPLRRLVIGRLIGRSACTTDIGFYSAPSASGSWQNPMLSRKQRRPSLPEASYHRLTVPFSDRSVIDETVFAALFGGSVPEYARFFAGISFEGLNFKDEQELGSVLSGGANFPTTIIKQRQRCGGTATAVSAGHVEMDRAEWAGLHRELNGGSPMSTNKQLPYFFDCAAAWSGPLSPATLVVPSTPPSAFGFSSASLRNPQVELHC